MALSPELRLHLFQTRPSISLLTALSSPGADRHTSPDVEGAWLCSATWELESGGCQAPMQAGSVRPESRQAPDGVEGGPCSLLLSTDMLPGLLCLCVSLIKRVFFNKASPRGGPCSVLFLLKNNGSARIGGGLPSCSQSSSRWSRRKSGIPH